MAYSPFPPAFSSPSFSLSTFPLFSSILSRRDQVRRKHADSVGLNRRFQYANVWNEMFSKKKSRPPKDENICERLYLWEIQKGNVGRKWVTVSERRKIAEIKISADLL